MSTPPSDNGPRQPADGMNPRIDPSFGDEYADSSHGAGPPGGADPGGADGGGPVGGAEAGGTDGGAPVGSVPPAHPAIAPLSFLLGRWEGAGVVGYPTIESANFGQEVSFSHNGKPFLIYASRTWLIQPNGAIGRPLAMEVGFWRPQPDGQVEVLLTHPTGITEIYLGTITGTKIEMATDLIARTSTAKEVTAGKRLYGLVGSDLAYAYDMAAVGQPLQPHLSAQLKRVAGG
jgi:hypothetical protein